jgi:hypothetical protein
VRYILTLCIYIFSLTSFAAPIKTVRYVHDGILNVNTALGIATIIQLPETIQSIIIGDQSGFKVEYLDKAVTIKPLRWGAKTNLYLVTEKQRYNLRLHTERQEQADFIIYIDTTKEEELIKWQSWNKKVQVEGWIFEILKIGKSKGGFFLLTGRLQCTECRPIKPETFWILQESKPKVINGLYLSKLNPSSKYPVEFGISLSRTDLAEKKPIHAQFKGDVTLSLDIPSEVLWK